MFREVERFVARSDDGSYKTTIVVRQHVLAAGLLSNPAAIIPGINEATTAEGFRCDYRGDGLFEINDPRRPRVVVRRAS